MEWELRLSLFFYGGGLVEEVEQITGLRRVQIEDLVSDSRKSGKLKRPTPEETRLRERKAHLGKPRESHTRNYSPDEQKSFLLARKFLEAGLISKNLTFGDKLSRLYERFKRPLPESFSERLRLEVFLQAREAMAKGEMGLLRQYKNLGEEVDPE